MKRTVISIAGNGALSEYRHNYEVRREKLLFTKLTHLMPPH